jgi:hypothetical protein
MSKARIAALCIGGIFVLLGLAVASTGIGELSPRAKAPAAILIAAGLAFICAGSSIGLNALNSSYGVRALQLSFGLAAIAALATVAVWAVSAPGESKSGFSLLFRL